MCSIIHSATLSGVYPYWYLGHSMDRISSHSEVGAAVNPLAISDAQAVLRQGPPLLDHSWSGITAHTYDHQFDTESTFVYGDEQAGALLLESPTTSTHDGEFPVIRPSEITDFTAFTHFCLSTLVASEGFGHAAVALNQAPTHIDPADVLNSRHEGTSVTSDQSSYTCVDTTAYMSGSPTVSRSPTAQLLYNIKGKEYHEPRPIAS
ncbi:hypothetical protein BJV74DRAFT_798357 [Russula compacta]|nr:hypothetical protein BJV74DRAFT_798357 [Russula compacta]